MLENLANVRAVMDLANSSSRPRRNSTACSPARSINQTDLRKYVQRVLKVEDDLDASTRMKNIIEEIVRLAETGRGNDLPSVRGTYWTGYNAVSEYLTHERGRNADNR